MVEKKIGTTDLSGYYIMTPGNKLFTDYYTEAGADNLLDTKVNGNNPHCIGQISGDSQVILNAITPKVFM